MIDIESRRAEDRAKLEAEHALALSLVQLHETKIRVLMGSGIRRVLGIPRTLLSKLTKGRTRPLQTFAEYSKASRERARGVVDSRLGRAAASRALDDGPDPLPQRAAELALAIQDSPLYELWRERRWGAAAADPKETLTTAAHRVLRKMRPSVPAKLLLSTAPGSYDDFRARVMVSPQHERLFEKRPLVSVIMPTHNRERLLVAAIDSVLRQSYPHLELLIVDDHSTDDTRQICQRYVASDQRVRYLENVGTGVAAARNTGIRNSGGDFIAYLDDDNVWSAEHLELMLTHILIEGSDFAYCSMRMTDYNGVNTFRGRHFSHADLLVQNYIDMNVVVHRREIVDRSGLFDESLERVVDWEFIIRATAAGRVSWAEFIGVDYSNDATRTDRLTVAKPFSWRFHVMNRYFVDWNHPSDDAFTVSVVVNAHGDADELERTLAEILRNSPEGGFELMAVDNRLGEHEAERLLLWSELIPSLRVVHLPQHLGLPLGYNYGAQFARGRILVFAALGVQLQPHWLEALVAGLEDEAIGVIQPVLEDGNGGVCSAGYGWSRFASDTPQLVRDAPRSAGTKAGRVAAVSFECAAMRRKDFVALRGFEPLFAGELLDLDLSFRIREHLLKACAVAGGASVIYAPRKRNPTDVPDSRDRFLGIWRECLRTLRKQDRSDGGSEGALDQAVQRSSHGGGSSGREGAGQSGKLKFSIKICCPSESVKLQWGDYHFAVSLRKQLVELGHDCRIDMPFDWYRKDRLEDVVIVLRGLYRYKPAPDAANIMWIVSHPNRVQMDELTGFDHVFVASTLFARQLAEGTHVSVSTMLQCTDPQCFFPDPDMPEGGRIVFVGNSRNVERPVVTAASKERLPAEIYGGGWKGLCRPEMVKAESVENSLVGDLYRGASIVLNDHWKDMQLHGFISNRLFDACACAAPVISDDVSGLDMFDGLVSVYRPDETLTPLVQRVLEEAPALRPRRLGLAKRIAAEHSFAARAAEIVEKSREIIGLMAPGAPRKDDRYRSLQDTTEQ